MFKKVISIIALLLLFMGISFAADGFYRLTHNDHDALVIGLIQEVNDEAIVVSVEKQIISDRDLNADDPIKQINLVDKTITINDVGHYSYFELDSTLAPIPKVGDMVLVSVNKEGLAYKKMWGLYKLQKKDTSYQVITSDIGSEYYQMDAVALQVFINSDGMINDFSFNGDTQEVYAEDQLIYSNGETIDENIELIVDQTTNNNNKETMEQANNEQESGIINKGYIVLIIGAVVALGILLIKLFKKID